MNFEAPPADNLGAGGLSQLHALNSSIMDFGLENFGAKEGMVEALFLPTSLGNFSDRVLHKSSEVTVRLRRLVPAALLLGKFLLPSL